MEKIHINLNPKVEKFDTLIFKELFYYAALGVGILLLVILLLGLFVTNGLSKYRTAAAKWNNWQDESLSLGKIKNELLELENEKKEFQKIITPKNQIANIFEDIFAALPQNVWFAALNLKTESLILKGYVVKLDEDYLLSLEKFITALRQRPYFSSKFKKINIRESQKQLFNGVEVLEFNIECLS